MCRSENCEDRDRYPDESPSIHSESPELLKRIRYSEYHSNDERSDARIMDQLGWTQEQLAKLNALVRELENKIEILLMPEESLPMAGEPFPPRKPASEMSNIIDDLNGQVSGLQGKVARITERVQL